MYAISSLLATEYCFFRILGCTLREAFLAFSRNFPTNQKSRKPLQHKAFRDFVLEIFLEIFFVCVAGVIFLDKYEYRIHMPRGFMDDFEGKVVGEKVHEGGLGEDIFSDDLYCEDALLTNI